MITKRVRFIWAGIFIITAYLMLLSTLSESIVFLFLVDLLSGLSVIGIATLLFSLFKENNKSLAFGYLILKIIEAIIMITGGIVVLFGNTEFREFAYEYIHIYPFIFGAILFYIMLYRTKLVPVYISIWGLIAVFFLTLVTILKWFSFSSSILDTTLILIITNEIYLAVYLIIKGLKTKN